MCKQYLGLFVVLLVSCLVDCAPPPGLTMCKFGDSKCIKETSRKFKSVFTAGMPEYGVEILDPLNIKTINATNGNLLFVLNDVTIVGLNNCDIKKIAREPSKILLKMVCTAVLDGTYVLKGSLLLFPIEGKGKIHVDLRSALFDLDIEIAEKIGEDGFKHWSVKSFKHTFDLKDQSDVVFENLFNGNDVLGQAARDLIKNNANAVVHEIGSPVIQYVISRVVKNVNHFFKAAPVKDLSIDN